MVKTPTILFILLLSFLLYSCSNQQTPPESKVVNSNEDGLAPSDYEMYIYVKNIQHSFKSVLIIVGCDSTILATGTATLVSRNGNIFLVTNYHLIPGFQCSDTTKRQNKYDKIAKWVKVVFHGLSDSIKVEHKYNLYDRNGNRLFTTPSSDTNTLFKRKGEVVDISFMKLPRVPKNIRLDTIPITSPKIFVDSSEIISVWGYRGGRLREGHFSLLDTARIAKSPYIEGMNYIIFSSHKSFSGNSGAPVFVHKPTGLEFIGIESSSLINSKGIPFVPPEFLDGSANQIVGIIIEKSFINYLISKYVN